MSFHTRMSRFFIGLVLLAVALAIGFAVFMAQMSHWGAALTEITQILPGDERLTAPLIDWTNGRTINARPEQVWPWLAQIGDTRGAFYSFTFIEDQVGSLMGDSSYKVNYTNANMIHPEWQNPQPGEEIIQGTLRWVTIAPGRWLLASATRPQVLGWTWLWQITPTADGQGTRLVNRIRIKVPSGDDNAIVSFFIGTGAFVMEQRMMNGIKARAEGWVEPPYQEGVEIALWFVVLLTGLAGALLFISRRTWAPSLSLGLASVAVIFTLTFAQPPIIVRVVLDAVLLIWLWWAAQIDRPRPAGARRSSSWPAPTSGSSVGHKAGQSGKFVASTVMFGFGSVQVRWPRGSASQTNSRRQARQ